MRSPENHHRIIFGRVVAFENEQINTKPVNTRPKFDKVNSMDLLSLIDIISIRFQREI